LHVNSDYHLGPLDFSLKNFKMDLLTTHSLSFCVSETVFISPSFWKIVLLNIRFLVDCFSFTLAVQFYCLFPLFLMRGQPLIVLEFLYMWQFFFLLLLSKYPLLSFSIFLWCLWAWLSPLCCLKFIHFFKFSKFSATSSSFSAPFSHSPPSATPLVPMLQPLSVSYVLWGHIHFPSSLPPHLSFKLHSVYLSIFNILSSVSSSIFLLFKKLLYF
jgi:hypothetical protein